MIFSLILISRGGSPLLCRKKTDGYYLAKQVKVMLEPGEVGDSAIDIPL